jgi:tape measure domain-containing protein
MASSNLELLFTLRADGKPARDEILAVKRLIDSVAKDNGKVRPSGDSAKGEVSVARLAAAQSRAATAAQQQTAATARAEAAVLRLVQAQDRAGASAQELANKHKRAEVEATKLALAEQKAGAAMEAFQRRQASGSSRSSGAFGGGSSTLRTIEAVAAGSLVAGAVRRVTGELADGGRAWLDYASKIQNARISFTVLLGSADAAEKHIRDLTEFAKKTPFQLSGLIEASQRMQALGFKSEQVIPILTDVGNAVAAAGGGEDRLQGVILALGQIQAKGRLATQEINQLAERGIDSYKILGQELGKTRAELTAMVEKGEISSRVFLEAFQKFSRAKFGDLMEQQSRTFQGAMSNIEDALLQTANKSFEPLFAKISEISIRFSKEIEGTQGIEGVLLRARSTLENLASDLGVAIGSAIVEKIGSYDYVGAIVASFDGSRLTSLGTWAGEHFMKGWRAGQEKSKQSPLDIRNSGGLLDELKFGRERRFISGLFDRGGVDPSEIGAPAGTPRNLSDLYVPLRTPDGPDPLPPGKKGGGGRKDNSAEQARQERIRQIQEDTRAIESAYRHQTDAIKREQELQLTSLQSATQAIIDAETDRHDNLVVKLSEQLALTKKESERGVLLGEIKEAGLERDRNIQRARDIQYQQERAAAEAHAQAMLRRGEQYDADRIASIKAHAELRGITLERAEEKIEAIESGAFKRRLDFNHAQIKALHLLAGFEFDAFGDIIENEKAQARLNVEELQRLQDEGSQIIAEWDGVVVESERKRSDARKRDLDNARAWAKEMRELEQSVLLASLAVGQQDIDRMRRRNIDKREVAKAQADHDRQDENDRHEAALAELRDQQDVYNHETHTFEERMAALIRFNKLRELEKERHNRRNKEIGDEEKQESGEGGDLLDPLREKLNERISLHNFAAQAIASSFDVITDAVGRTLQSYILTGELSGKLIRKAVAEQIAALAMLALKQGMYWTAQGIADLFWNPPRAAADFAAAAGFFALAGAGAFIGRKVAGNAFKEQASGGSLGAGGGEAGAGGGVNYAPFNYNSGAQPSSSVAGDGSRNTGGMGGMVRGLIDEVRADSARREAAMHQTMYQVAEALRPFTTASPEAIVQRGLDSSTGERAAGDAVLRRQQGSHEFTREFLANSGFSR